MSEFVTIHEMGPRDGLQNEPGAISVDDKVGLVNALADAGLRQIEVGSFVSPKWVPQMADTDKVTATLPALDGGQYDVLVPNMKGWEGFSRSSRQGTYGIAVFISASEGFSQANLNCSIAESVERLRPVVDVAVGAGVPVRGYVSCVTDCPFDGPVAPEAVADAAGVLRDSHDMPISLGDTIGKGTPDRIGAMLEAVLQAVPATNLAGHYHDTSGKALANIDVSLALGLRHFDSAVGGLGGCPYAPGAPGNVATEAVVAHLHAKGYQTGVDPERLRHAALLAQTIKRNARENAQT
ncbi:hydroxymethylglutaryl-CoA lyase [Cognatiyoonia sediminum]|nr:hydroxymethylglutaryl-CoA lyase [Cognatiyoonia sediminum]